ncbi:hypothetical protein MPSEU_000420000 [Mayamaea pseudoterrestris]|nr:hypothetical protein MPSEU_000420000 [Mayamaea pseudoterrestris]
MSIYNYLFGGSSSDSNNNEEQHASLSNSNGKGAGRRAINGSTKGDSQEQPVTTPLISTEQTALLVNNAGYNSNGNSNQDSTEGKVDNAITEDVAALPPIQTQQHTLRSAYDFYFTPTNPTIQNYYRFTVTPLQPMAALHKRPVTAANQQDVNQNVTGILRRSAVVPSHGTDASGTWILVSVGGRSGWARKQSELSEYQQLQQPIQPQPAGFVLARTFRAKDAWMGNHAFLLKGKIMLGSDAPSLFFTNALLLVGFGIYFGLLLPRLQKELAHRVAIGDLSFVFLSHNPSWIWWTSFALAVLTMLTLWAAAMTDPGILPAHSSPHKPPPPSGAASLIGGPLGYRYCSTCNIYRPPRSKHCNSCNVCVDRMDHHCPWIGTCVAARNYRFFFVFLVCVAGVTILTTLVAVQLVLMTYASVLASEALPGVGPQIITMPPAGDLPPPPPLLRGISRHHHGDAPVLKDFAKYGEHTTHIVWRTLLHQPVTVIFGIFNFLCAWSLLSLLAYHAMIISVAQTTNERVRGVYRYASAVNVDDQGCMRNWWNALCRPRKPSLLPPDFSELVVCGDCTRESEWSGDLQIGMAPDGRTSSADLDAGIDVPNEYNVTS